MQGQPASFVQQYRMENSLQNFLEDEAEDGAYEGEGGFTLSLQRAQTLVEYSIPRPYAWASLLVQAAVLMGCPRLDITQTRYTSRFLFPIDDERLTILEKQMQNVPAPAAGGGRPEEKFALAIAYVNSKGANDFVLTLTHSGGQASSSGRGTLHAGDRGWKSPPGTVVLQVSHWHPPSAQEVFPALPARRERLEIYAELTEHCAASPIPISLDSRPLKIEKFFALDKSDALRVPINLHFLEAPPQASIFPFPCSLDALYAEAEKTCSSLVPSDRLGGFLTVALNMPKSASIPPLSERSTLVWVQSGVAIESEQLPFKTRYLCCTLFATANDLKTDLTSFQLLRDENYLRRKQEALAAFRAAADRKEQLEVEQDQVDAASGRRYGEYKYPLLLGNVWFLWAVASGFGLIASVGGAVAMFYGMAAGPYVAGALATIASFTGVNLAGNSLPLPFAQDKAFLKSFKFGVEKDLEFVTKALSKPQ